MIYFDFKKVFDCVLHLRVLHKLNELGICGRLNTGRWRASLPKGRSESKLERSTPSEKM